MKIVPKKNKAWSFEKEIVLKELEDFSGNMEEKGMKVTPKKKKAWDLEREIATKESEDFPGNMVDGGVSLDASSYDVMTELEPRVKPTLPFDVVAFKDFPETHPDHPNYVTDPTTMSASTLAEYHIQRKRLFVEDGKEVFISEMRVMDTHMGALVYEFYLTNRKRITRSVDDKSRLYGKKELSPLPA